MKLAVIGAGQLGYQVYSAATNSERMLIDTHEVCPECFRNAELGYSRSILDAAKCEIVALAVPPSACQQILETICPLMKGGSIILNFPTKYLMPETLKSAFPKLNLMESKLLGSAVGLSKGLDHRIILSEADASVVEQIKACLPGMRFTVGDYLQVPKINMFGMKAALAAAIRLEKDLREQGYSEELIQPAVGGLMAGSIISYAANTLGEFGLDLVDELKQG